MHKFNLLRSDSLPLHCNLSVPHHYNTRDIITTITIDFDFLLFGFKFPGLSRNRAQDNVSNVDQIARRRDMVILLHKLSRFLIISFNSVFAAKQ